ncbi:hypothetical protein MHYP_G00271080 [Metynnis hypsauchen]
MPPNAFVMRGARRGGPGSQEREACDILGEMAGRSVPRLDLKSVLGSHKVRAGEQLRGAPSAASTGHIKNIFADSHILTATAALVHVLASRRIFEGLGSGRTSSLSEVPDRASYRQSLRS